MKTFRLCGFWCSIGFEGPEGYYRFGLTICRSVVPFISLDIGTFSISFGKCMGLK